MNTHDKAGAGWFSHPVLSVICAVAWLLMRQSLSPADLIAAVVLGLVIPRVVHGFLGLPARPRAWFTAATFTAVVLYDIVKSNVTVARLVLDPVAKPRPAWVPVKLSTTNPTAITLLATVITTTPGTVSCVVDEARGEILVHALDCDDPAALAAEIRQRYEAPLKEIFG